MSSIISYVTSVTSEEVLDIKECPICYDKISVDNNNCTTPCGHQFCFKCLMLSIARNNSCPCCRAPLTENTENAEDDSDSDSDSDNESDNSNESVNHPDCNIERIVDKITVDGFTMTDIVSILLDRYPVAHPRYTEEFCDNLHVRFYDMVDTLNEEAYSESDEMESMSGEDTLMSGRNIRENLLPAFDNVEDLPLVQPFEAPNLILQAIQYNYDGIFIEPSGDYSFI